MGEKDLQKPDRGVTYLGEHEVTWSPWYASRQFEKASNHSVVKLLTELITNSDDSYCRLESSDLLPAGTVGTIVIINDRKRRRMAVIDGAEGLDEQAMVTNFVKYGGGSKDLAHGLATRSLFGKGLRDVLFSQNGGVVKSIRDDRFYTCEFRLKGKGDEQKHVIDTNGGRRVTPEQRKGLGITGNGTRVEFVLREDFHLPQHEKLVRRLATFYMLRPITSNPRRSVLLRTISTNGIVESRVTYEDPVGELIHNMDFIVEWDAYKVRARGSLYRAEVPLTQGETGYENRDGGLLIRDETGSVLDLTLFGFDREVSAANLFGDLTLNGAAGMIRERLSEREEIITETRDGFNAQHPFYKALANQMSQVLRPIVEAERQRRRAPAVMYQNQAVFERHREAFASLNKLHSELLGTGEEGPGVQSISLTKPTVPLEFRPSFVSLRTGSSVPVLLLCNTDFIPDKSSIGVASDHPGLDIAPQTFEVDHRNARNGAVRKVIHLTAVEGVGSRRVTASCERFEAGLIVNVSDQAIDVNGLQFKHGNVFLRPSQRRPLRILVNTRQIPLASKICLSVTGDGIILSSPEIEVQGAPDESGFLELSTTVSGSRVGARAEVQAICGEYVDECVVAVRSKVEAPEADAGLFKWYRFEKLSRSVPAQLDDGWVLINLKDPTNQLYFGEDPVEAQARVEKVPHCQVRLAELIIDECLQVIVSTAYQENKLDHRLDYPPDDIRNYITEFKFRLGPNFHGTMVDQATAARALSFFLETVQAATASV